MQTASPPKIDLSRIQDLCKRSLKFLCEQILKYGDWDLVHDDIERMLFRPARRKLILVPRGHLKTAIITKAYAIKTLLANHNARILIANQVWDKSREMLFEIKEYLTTKSELPKIFGAFESHRWTADEIVIRQRNKALAAASIATTGVEAETTSSHYDLIILDDIQGLQNCQTKEQRDKVKRFYSSMIDLVEQSGQLIVVGTRWHLDDVYQHILDNETEYYEVMVRKVIENGKLIFPKKFQLKMDTKFKQWTFSSEPCMEFIDYLKRSKGSDFYSQYMNNPIDEENQLFKKEYFRYWQRRPERLFMSMTVDLAISQKQSADYSAIIICGMDNNHNIYVMDYIFGHWRPSDVVDNIFQMRSKWNPQICGIETHGFQETMKYDVEEEMRKRRYHFPITEIKAPSNLRKEYKIKALEPFYKNNSESLRDSGKIYHAEWMRDKDLEHQLMAFTVDGSRAKHDDLIDALSMQLNLLMPGGSEPRTGIPVGSFEWHAREARKSQINYDFFTYG